MKNLYTAGLIAVLLMSSCKPKGKTGQKNNIETINISAVFQKKEKVKLSSITEKIEYIQLESNKGAILNRISDPTKDIQFSENRIFIKDASNYLLSFDSLGKFITKIGNVGHGPGEYPRINEFTILDKEKKIVVHSAELQKALVFNYQGKHINSFNTGFWSTGLISYNGNLIFGNSFGRRKFTEYYSLNSYSSKGKLLGRFLHKPLEERIDKEKQLIFNFTTYNSYVLNDTLRYWETGFDKDTIWSITKDSKDLPSLIVNFDDNIRPFDVFAHKQTIGYDDMLKYSSLEYFQESSRYMFLELYKASEKKVYKAFFDKKTNKSTSLEYERKYTKGFHFSFYNDIDKGMPFWPQGKVSDDKMYMLIYGYDLKEYLAKHKKNTKTIDSKGYDNLLKLVKNSKISDNPILMIVTLKK